MPRPHAELENDWGKKVSLKRRRRRRAGQASKEGIEKRCRRDIGKVEIYTERSLLYTRSKKGKRSIWLGRNNNNNNNNNNRLRTDNN